MNFKSVLVFSFSLILNIAAQNFSVTGKVIDLRSGNALSGVTVFISPSHSEATNSEGSYALKNIHAGKYHIRV